MSQIFRAAVVQNAPAAFDLPNSLDHTLALIAQAAGQGAQLVVFPEAFLGGYPKGLDFGARVGMRAPEGRDLFRRYYEGALDVPGPATAALGAAARAHTILATCWLHGIGTSRLIFRRHQRLDLYEQHRHVPLNRLPDHIQTHIEVLVGQAIAHASYQAPWHLGVLLLGCFCH